MAISRKIIRDILLLKERGLHPTGILDIGSYIGEFALNMRNNFKNVHIVMIDPLEEQNQVCTHIANRIGDAEFKQALVGDYIGERTFHLVDQKTNPNLNLSGSSVYKEQNNFPFVTRNLQQTTIEELLKDDTRKYDLIKISAPGAEIEVLKGFGKRLDDVDVVIMKMNLLDYNIDAPLIGHVLYNMEQLGFVLWDLPEEHRMGTPDLFQVDGIFLRKDSEYRPHSPFFTA